MANSEDEVRDLREKNSELALEVQHWKMTASKNEKEKVDLMKELNEMRLKLSVLRSNGAAQARKLDTALQSATEEALSHLVQASGAVARTIELSKQYMREREELESISPRFSSLGGTPSAEKIHRVPPLLLGGQSLQPVVALSRTMLNNRSMTRSPNQNSGVTQRAVPMHILQDVSIPLTRIDLADLHMNAAGDENNSADDLGLEDSNEVEDEHLVSMGEVDESGGLDAVMEDVEPESGDDTHTQSRLLSVDNPLEGPSWLLDQAATQRPATRVGIYLEPDSTTPSERRPPSPSPSPSDPPADPPAPPAPSPPDPNTSAVRATLQSDETEKENVQSLAFTPTVRRRKRASSNEPPPPTFSPRPHRKHTHGGRVLKVLVAKMRFSEDPGGTGDSTPAKRPNQVKSPRRSSIELSRPSIENSRTSIEHSTSRTGRRQIDDGSRLDSPTDLSANGNVDCTSRRPGNLDQRSMDHDSRTVEVTPRRLTVELIRTPNSSIPQNTSITNRSPKKHKSRTGRRSREREGDGDRQSERDRQRSPRFDAPSPNGATDAGVIVSETPSDTANTSSSSRLAPGRRRNSVASSGSGSAASDGDDTRTRRARPAVSYKEKPLNRKLRR